MIEMKIFIDESDVHEGKPLSEYIMRYCMHHEIRGATIFAAHEGFGRKHHLHRPKHLGNVDEEPLMIVVIDDDDKIMKVLPHIRDLVVEGLIVTHRVDVQ